MALWIKILVGIILGLMSLLALALVLVFIMIRIPKLDISRNDPAASQTIETWFESLHAHSIVPFNGIVLVRRGGDTLLRKAYGMDSKDQPLTIETALRLGSVSKQFTAVGILTLVEGGKIDLDLPISTYIPGCEFSASVKSLLNHTSGIPDTVYQRAHETDVLTLQGVENLMCDKVIKETSDGNFSYSNTGYLLAARIIEHVSGETFEAYMQRAVFDALNMQNSRVWNLVSETPYTARAGGFENIGKNKRKSLEPTNLDGVAGDGGVFSNLDDLENWDLFWFDDRLISPDLKQLALTPDSGDYAFGWLRDGNWAWHNGSWLGARTYISRNLETGDLIVLLENSANPQVDNIGIQLQSFLDRTEPMPEAAQ